MKIVYLDNIYFNSNHAFYREGFISEKKVSFLFSLP